MDSPFRNDVDALKTRLASLGEELTTLRSKAREYETTRERLTQVEREHEDLRREIDARQTRRAAPLLDNLRIASPCNESWDSMVGDDRSRFCARCEKHVHNLSELTRDQAETFLQNVTESACVRIYQRADGTVLTSDCPVGVQKKRVKRLFLATVGAGLAVAAGAVAFWAWEEATMMGSVAGGIQAPVPPTTEPQAPPAPTFATPPTGRVMMGVAPTSSVVPAGNKGTPKGRSLDLEY